MLYAFKLIDATAHIIVLDTWTIIMLLMTAVAKQIMFSQMPLTYKEYAIILRVLKIYTMSSAKQPDRAVDRRRLNFAWESLLAIQMSNYLQFLFEQHCLGAFQENIKCIY